MSALGNIVTAKDILSIVEFLVRYVRCFQTLDM